MFRRCEIFSKFAQLIEKCVFRKKMASKTRDKLIDVARQLFARKGLAHTTMNDIAAASDKGRRTIYTYFKSKREIYNAVIERESDRHVEKLRAVAENTSLDPEHQLFEFLLTRYNSAADPAGRTLLSKFSLDLKRTERVRQLAYAKEQQLLDRILQRGLDSGIFDSCQTDRVRAFMHRWLMAVDWSAADDSPQSDTSRQGHISLIEFIVKGILKNHH